MSTVKNNKRMWRTATLVHCWREWELAHPLWKSLWRLLKSLKTELPYDLRIPVLGIHPKEMQLLSQRDSCTRMFIAVLFTIAKVQKQPKCLSTEEWIKKIWHTYKVEYYSSLKKKEILSFATTWMNLEGFMLSETSQTEKDKCSKLTHTWNLKKKRKKVALIKTAEEWLPGVRGWGEIGEVVFTSTNFQF